MRPRRRLAIPLALLAFAGCGDGKDEPADLAPARSIVFVDATLEPEGDQREAVESLVERFPGSGPAGERIQRLLGQALSRAGRGLSYEEDVDPWLAEKAGFFASSVAGASAALIQTEDEEKAREAVEKAAGEQGQDASYEGEDYSRYDEFVAGTVEGFLVVGDERGFRAAVDAADGESLNESDDYENAVEDAPEDRLALIYFNGAQLARSARGFQRQLLGPFRRLLREPIVSSVKAEADGLELESELSGSLSGLLGPFFGEGTERVGDVPADSWLALGQPRLGRLLDTYVGLFAGAVGGRGLIEQQLRSQTGLDLDRDVLGWMGDFAVFVRGTSEATLSGALVIETTDERASARALRALGRLLRGQGGVRVGPLTTPGGGTGFTLRAGEVPQPIHVFQRSGRVVAAYGDRAARDALRPASTLRRSPGFTRAADALGEGFAVSTYVAVDPILRLAESVGAADDPDYRRARPYLEPLDALVAGTKREGDRLLSRLRIDVR